MPLLALHLFVQNSCLIFGSANKPMCMFSIFIDARRQNDFPGTVFFKEETAFIS